MEWITSKENEKIKALIKLQTSRKMRRESGLFVTEGVRLAQEALRCNLVVKQVFATEDVSVRHPALWESLRDKSEFSALIAPTLEGKISDVQTPQGIYCVCQMPVLDGTSLLSAGTKFLALDALQDPGNVGTIIRTADAFGADGLILGEGCADLYSPKVLRSAMGSVFRQRIWEVSNLADTLCTLSQSGFAIYGAALNDTALRLDQVKFPPKTVAVIGNEGNGISKAVLDACQHQLYIPMDGEAESLNAGVAASVILWEMRR